MASIIKTVPLDPWKFGLNEVVHCLDSDYMPPKWYNGVIVARDRPPCEMPHYVPNQYQVMIAGKVLGEGEEHTWATEAYIQTLGANATGDFQIAAIRGHRVHKHVEYCRQHSCKGSFLDYKVIWVEFTIKTVDSKSEMDEIKLTESWNQDILLNNCEKTI